MREVQSIADSNIARRERYGVQRDELGCDDLAPVTGLVIEPQPTLNTYLRALRRRRWTVITAIVLLTTLAGLVSFKMKPVYRSTARIEVDAETRPIQSLDEYQQPPLDQDFLRTQIEVLKTDVLAWKTVEQARLAESPELMPSGKDKSEERKILLIHNFQKHLAVELIPGSRIVQVSFESTDPVLAAKAANSLVDNYLDYNFREKYDAARTAAGRMEQQLDELQAKVEKSQRDLVDYQREHAIVDVNDKQSVVEQRLGELSTQLTMAESDRIQKESLYNLARTSPEKVALLAQNELLQKLEERRADLEKQYAEALGQYGPNFPKAMRLRKEMDESQTQIDAARKRFVERINRDYQTAVTRESLLTQAVEKQKQELGEFNKLLVQQNILKGEFDSNQKLYERLLEHLKDATVSAGLKSTNIHSVDTALVPTDPIRPRKILNLAVAILVGLFFGTALAFAQESLDHSVKSAEDVEGLVSVPVLAVIPAAHSLPPTHRRLHLGNGNGKISNGDGILELAVLNGGSSVLAESLRALRTSILLSTASRPPQTILITSPNSGEGKTTIAVNVALALAQQHQSEVLLIDGDLRKPRVGRVLGLANGAGLSTVLAGGDINLDNYPALQRLWVLQSGPVPPNPTELLSSPGMAEELGRLRERFRFLVIDSPPILMVTDAMILSRLVDGVLLVTESGVTLRSAVVRSCRMLQSAGAKTLAIVLNKCDLRLDGYYGSYGYKGYYGYGTSEEPPRESAL